MFSILSYHNNYSVHTGSRLEYYSREGERDPLRGYDEGTGMAHNAGPPLLYGYGYSGRCGAQKRQSHYLFSIFHCQIGLIQYGIQYRTSSPYGRQSRHIHAGMRVGGLLLPLACFGYGCLYLYLPILYIYLGMYRVDSSTTMYVHGQLIWSDPIIH